MFPAGITVIIQIITIIIIFIILFVSNNFIQTMPPGELKNYF